MTRRLFNLVALLSLLLFLAVAALWVAGFWVVNSFQWASRQANGTEGVYRQHTVGAEDGAFWWSAVVHVGTLPPGLVPEPAPPPRWERYSLSQSRIEFLRRQASPRSRLGFVRIVQSHQGINELRSETIVIGPAWPLAMTLSLPPVLWLIARTRTTMLTRSRRRRGLCPACGYDLRGAPGACPECGNIAAAPAPG